MENSKKTKVITALLFTTTIGVGMLTGCNKSNKGNIQLENTYTIDYELFGGENGKDNPTSYTTGLGDVSLQNPSKNGYVFKGWYLDKEFNEEITSISSETKGNITLYAKFEAIEYTITYDLDGGELAKSNPKKYTIETPTFTLNNPTKHGYDFVGWEDLDTGNVSRYRKFVKGSQSNKSYKARWRLTTYSITVVSEHGLTTIPGGAKKDEEFKFEITPDNGYELESITLDGNLFDINKRDFIMPDHDIKFVIKYSPITYHITYDLNEGQLHGEKLVYEYNVESEDIYLPLPTKKGHSFWGWKAKETDSPNKNVIIKRGSYGDLNYKAYWLENTYGVEVVLSEHGRVEVGQYRPSYGERFNFAIVCDDGWIVDKVVINGVDYPADTRSYVVGDSNVKIAVYYKEKPSLIEYTIDYDLDGGDLNGKNLIRSYTSESEDIYLPSLSKKGYIFLGWSKNNIEEPNINTIIKKGSSGNLSYTAKWKPISYDVAINSEHGQVMYDGNNLPKYGEIFKFEIVPNEGWQISELYINGIKVGKETRECKIDEKGFNIKVIYTKIPKPLEYTISYDSDGGKLESGKYVYTYNENSEAIVLPILSKQGYDFLGWSKDNADEPKLNIVIDPKETKENLSYTAKWKVKEYNVNIINNLHGEFKYNKKPTYNEMFEFEIIPDEGWIVENIIINDKIYSASVNSYLVGDENLNIEINYKEAPKAIEYTIEYDLDGGNLIAPNPVTYTKDTPTFTLNNPVKRGYEFVGWSRSDKLYESNNTIVIEKGTTGNLKYIAKWKMNIYSFSISNNDDEGTFLIEGLEDKDLSELDKSFFGWDIHFNIVPKQGYKIEHIIINGEEVPLDTRQHVVDEKGFNIVILYKKVNNL